MKWKYKGDKMTVLDLLTRAHAEKLHEQAGEIKNCICQLEDISFFSMSPETISDIDDVLKTIYDISTDIMKEADKFRDTMEDLSAEVDSPNLDRKIDEMEI